MNSSCVRTHLPESHVGWEEGLRHEEFVEETAVVDDDIREDDAYHEDVAKSGGWVKRLFPSIDEMTIWRILTSLEDYRSHPDTCST